MLVTTTITRGGVDPRSTTPGLGIADDALSEINDKLSSGGEVTPDTARRMGLFVVSRLAQRHGLSVALEQNDRGGITATVFLPTNVLSDTARLEAGVGRSPGHRARRRPGRRPRTSTPSTPSTTSRPRSCLPAPDPEPAEQELRDPINAAINAYGLPQRRPGATGAGWSP